MIDYDVMRNILNLFLRRSSMILTDKIEFLDMESAIFPLISLCNALFYVEIAQFDFFSENHDNLKTTHFDDDCVISCRFEP